MSGVFLQAMQLEAEESDFTEAFDFDSMHDMGNLDAMFMPIGGQAGGSAVQVCAVAGCPGRSGSAACPAPKALKPAVPLTW